LEASVGDDEYREELIENIPIKLDENYIMSLMAFESNEVEFKATFHVPVYSKTDKKILR
jgi:hypothetical protein